MPADFFTHKLIDAKLEGDNTVQDVVTCGDMLIPDGQRVAQELDFHSLQPDYQTHSSFQAKPPSTAKVDAPVVRARNDEAGELKKLDSFGRWMNKEMGGDCDDSLMASDSGNYWDMLDTEKDKEVSNLSRHMRLSIDSMGPSLSQEQLFSICDFAPDWAYSGVETKVLFTGTFLGDKIHCSSFKWSCMFGEIEVTADVLADNVIRCQVPFHAPGRVPLYITCSNRLACSEVREFEYREKTPEAASSINVKSKPEDEVQFQIRLAKMLAIGTEKKWLNCSAVGCDKCELKKNIGSLKAISNILLGMIENAITFFEGHSVSHGDVLIENLLKVKLYEWIICKVHEGGKGLHILDSEGQGVIHLAAALGFQWVMDPIVAAGVSPNFRDVRGKTALHWASYYGREETVIALMRLGAAVGAVDDPTSASAGGQTAADLASSRGHKGIAGYLAEADLTSHLSCLTIGGNSMESAAASIEAEKALETAAQNVLAPGRAIDEQRSLRGSLAAVRTSARAAALIQAAFRARSFRHRQLAKSNNDTSKAPLDLVALGLLNKGRRVTHCEDYLHSAAIKIQQKYCGWKGRKDFLKIRNRIVKIQAHVRGHQVRKQYKKVVWSVSIVEKAILRWRRKGHGLQGFRMEKTIGNVLPDSEKNDEYEFLRIGRKQKIAGVEKALARVQSMVRHPEARDQYMRLVSKYENSELSKEAESASLQADTTKEK